MNAVDLASDRRALASTLAPVLHEACEHRLGELAWFRADWQRGGAATATSTLKLDDGARVDVVVKLPVNVRELRWTRRLQDTDEATNRRGSLPAPDDDELLVPRLFASGDTLGGYDLSWIVIERIAHGPLGLKWHDDHVMRVAEAAARFHKATSAFDVDREPRREDWEQLVADARQSVIVNDLEDRKQWNALLRTFSKMLTTLVPEWRARPITHWVHGDVHMANAMSRVALDRGPVCLIDLAEVHPGHWVEDAIYLERRFWARPEHIKTHKPMKALSQARKVVGLAPDPDDQRLATIRRAFLAATAPAFMKTEGHPKHLEACLNRLDQSLRQLG